MGLADAPVASAESKSLSSLGLEHSRVTYVRESTWRSRAEWIGAECASLPFFPSLVPPTRAGAVQVGVAWLRDVLDSSKLS